MKKLIWILSFFLVFSCDTKDEEDVPKEIPEVTYIKAPNFDQDSAFTYIQKQVNFGFRVPNTPEHVACGDWLVEKLRLYGAEVVEQSFRRKAYDGKVLNLRNIIGSFNIEAKKRILLAAHWDSRHLADRDEKDTEMPIEGANDGASGVGVLLEIARQINLKQPKVGIDIIFFDGEDYGQPDQSDFPRMQDSWCLGSQYWSREKHKKGYKAKYGILLDMVGATGARFAKEGASRSFAPQEVQHIWNTAARMGYSNYFWNFNSPEITDDHVYVSRDAKIPMVDIIEYNPTAVTGGYFGDYHHTHADNMSVIDKTTLKAVGQTVMEVIYNE